MTVSLEALLPSLAPGAIAWVRAQSAYILESGLPLLEGEMRLARSVGVARPDKIRISVISRLPLPDDPDLLIAALETGLLGPGMVGVTFGYGIYVCDGHRTNRLIAHECRHVYKYEMSGSIEAFLPVYLRQIATVGYHNAPLEIDARQHENDV